VNLLDLRKRLARRRNVDDSSPPTAFVSLSNDLFNEAHRTILRKPGMASLRYALVTFPSVASTQQYCLPTQGVARINRIWETTNDIKLQYRTMDWLRTQDPDPITGTPCYWIPTGFSEVHTQPSDASSVFVDSTAAGDTGTAYVEGITTGGYYQSKSVTMTGTTAVNISTAVTDWVQITKFYLSTAAVGTVTLHEDASGGTELSKIAIGDVRAQFLRFLLYPTPAAAVTYSCDITRAIPDMSNTTDEPLLPEDFHNLLVDMAELRLTKKADDPSRYAMLTREVADATRDLVTWVGNHPDYSPQWVQDEPERSALGAWYPDGS
jgi:hypothetical protein